MSLGHQSLTYSQPETASWKHWPQLVLASLRQSGLAPLRFDTGTAGGVLTKRSPAGIFYREWVGWYLGSDLEGREVFVRIRATQSLRPLDPEGRRLVADGTWAVSTDTWLPRERKRLKWSSNGQAGESEGATAATRDQIRAIPMPDLFVRCLMGVPSECQRAVLEAMDFATGRPWGDARAWGYTEEGLCTHGGPCEHVVLAAISRETLVVMQAERFPSRWDSWVVRASVEETPETSATRAKINAGSETDPLNAR